MDGSTVDRAEALKLAAATVAEAKSRGENGVQDHHKPGSLTEWAEAVLTIARFLVEDDT